MTPLMRARLLGEPTPQQQQQAQKPPPQEQTASLLSIKFAPSTSTLSSTVTAPGLHTAVAFVRAQHRAAAAAPAPEPPKPQFVRVTRETRAWAPARLLCKRFGVPVPDTTVAAEERRPAPAEEAPPPVAEEEAPTGPAPPEDQMPSELSDPAGAAVPALDLFKAIFDTPLVAEPEPEPEHKPEPEPEPEESLPMLFPQPPPGFVPGIVRTDASVSRSSSHSHHHHHHHKHKHKDHHKKHKDKKHKNRPSEE